MKLGEQFDDDGVRNCLREIPLITQRLNEEYDEDLVSVVGVESKLWRRLAGTLFFDIFLGGILNLLLV